MEYHWDFGAVWLHKTMLLAGLIGTFRLALVSIVLGVVIGIVVAIGRLSRHRVFSKPATWFTEFYRNTPPIVHFYWFFYALPVVANVSLDPYWAAIIALSTQSGAFYAEVFRGGITSVERGQWEGARAIGMRYPQIMIRVILPQATRRMVGPFVERSFELLKTTSLASTLAYADLVYQAMQVNSQTFRPLEVYSTVAFLYFISLFTMSMIVRIGEHRLARYA
ncbi:amino acid ABC transporter permease [Burkholderia sp. Ac-20344]|uniref:amino acid ABC transporter permease n=1 Tax=Burkholderia sp. Ac-20344 TaxID=2703890 RepID=UPI00197BC792|nr:amino acid ABC transporter permease [Burkholderia sp. Ac-20344]MBN3835025.1 amino acid ABC transporter permease [Burkholderia sp. Ac-20344]